jgi:hypothetical protein
MSENVGASTSRNPKGLHGLYRDNFTYVMSELEETEKEWVVVCYCSVLRGGMEELSQQVPSRDSNPVLRKCEILVTLPHLRPNYGDDHD